MSNAKDNLALTKSLYQLFNDRKLDEAMKHVASDCTWTSIPTGETHRGPTGFKEFCQGWITAFSDARVDIQSQIANDDYVITEFFGRGLHDGNFKSAQGTIPATRKKLDLRFCEILRIKDGKVSEGRIYFDAATMMRQLGLLGETAGKR